ncbi:virginiamycin B lyase, partial [Streptomyces sp. NPDC058157]
MTDPRFTLHPVPGAATGPYGITAGPDGALWATLVHAGAVLRLHPGGRQAVHPLGAPGSGPSVITEG